MPNPAAAIGALRTLGQVALLAAAYFATAKASLVLAIPPGYATAVWPPSGIALAAILLLGTRVWPGICLGAAAVNFTVASSVLDASIIGIGNTLEALTGAALLRRYIGGPRCFERVRHVVTFVAVAALCPIVAATIAVLALALRGAVPWPQFLANWWTWWQGDMTGIVIVAPLLLTWRFPEATAWSRAKVAEAILFAASLLLVAFVNFGAGIPLAFTFLAFIIWAAFRFSQRVVATAAAAVCVFAVWDTLGGRGIFAMASLNQSLLLLLAFIGTTVTSGLMLGAAVNERRDAMDRLARAMDEMHEQARADPLTGLANRRSLQEFLQREWLRATRRQSSLAVVMIDIDHFKRINDAYGHEAGDVVLTEIAALLKAHVRGSDAACRFGGEEFVLVLPDAGIEGVKRRAEGIREAIARLQIRWRDRLLGRISASLGVALFPDHAADPEALLRASDLALYEAKRAGRDRVVVSRARPGLRAAG